ncbi:hypothetical protein CTEN210_14902 [Chaetoceros tenuissimus]|uniref:Ubiquitin-like protease family profile domain-containing protein n=1 Tax=Chaetoceros tenuissimus TaxID=426638 RepID=A0AAD3HCQ5_9STRA|nr:hypothetical protein CTEN210_14902 [Chaetoceros tenuissimus]
MTRPEPMDASSEEEGNEYNSSCVKLGKTFKLEDQKCWIQVPDSYDLAFQINILKLLKKYPDQRNARVIVGFNGDYYFYRTIQSDANREERDRVADYWDNLDKYDCDDDSALYDLLQRARQNHSIIVAFTVDSDEGSSMYYENDEENANDGKNEARHEDENELVSDDSTKDEEKNVYPAISEIASKVIPDSRHKLINLDNDDVSMEKVDQGFNLYSEALGEKTEDGDKQSCTKLTNSKRNGDGILSTKSSKKQKKIKEQNSAEISKTAEKAGNDNVGKKSTSKEKAKKTDIETNKVTSPQSSPKPQSRHFLDEDITSSTGSPLYKSPLRRSTRSSTRKSRRKDVKEVIELSSDEESDDDIPTPQPTPSCDNDAAIAASLNQEVNQELNHSIRNNTGTEQEECENYSRRISPRTRSRGSKCFVECNRVAIGNCVYFENMELSFVCNKFELDLDHKCKLRIDVKEIEEIHYYMPDRHELGTESNIDAESDESKEEYNGNENDPNESADSSDDDNGSDLKKNLNAQKKRIAIDDEEDEEDEEQSRKVVSPDFEDDFEEAKSSTNEEIADDNSRESIDNVETTSLSPKPDYVSKSIIEPTEEAEDDIRSHYYLILRAKPSKENGLTTFTSNKHYYKSMPKTTPTKSTQLAKRYIVIKSSSQTDFESLITLLKENVTIGMYFVNDNNRLTHENLGEEIVSLLNAKKPLKPICKENETALVFPSLLLETELDSVSSNLNEPNGKIGQNHESMFIRLAIKEKVPNGKQNNHIITIRGEDYDRLSPGEFLNDTLIDFWISWLIYNMGNVSNQVHVFTTQFYTKLEEEGVESVKSWTAKKNIDIFEKKYVFVPVNKDIHWSLLVIVNPGNIFSDDDEEARNQNLEHPYILFMDSLRAHKKARLQKTLHKWLNAEAARLGKFDRKDPYENSTCPVENAHVPRQDNCWDCGVFICRYAFAMLQLLDTRIQCKLADWRDAKFRRDIIKEYITETEAFDFGMDDIARLREEMAILIQDLHQIYKQKIEEKKTKKRDKKQHIQMQQENN